MDPEGGPLTFTVVTGPAHGTLSGTAPSLLYHPDPNFNGSDGLTFRASDGQANSNLATVAIEIQAQNDPPLAVGDSYSLTAGSVLTVSAPGVLGNDTDIDSGLLQAELAAGPAHGALVLDAAGSFTYSPPSGYSGPDSFSYVAADGQSTSGVAVVSLTVNPPADTTPPVRSNGQPSGTLPVGTVQATLSLTTSEAAACRYATTAGVVYPSMPGTFSTTGGTTHSTQVTGLANGGSYAYQVRCQDAAGNQNVDDFGIAFSVAAPPPDTTAPAVTMTSPAAGATVAGTVTVTANASDNVAVSAVQFLLDGVPLGAEDTTAPYSVSWNSSARPTECISSPLERGMPRPIRRPQRPSQ